ncbi:prephenate dehydrogenase [Flavobacterium subsaxonicum]|uniref:Prephenate dehydrogenase n=1 Tax=Flavobacterium subsaxonicum WB 4.1-42 = DSM 21790 TaxID=1121898 RepID=A0A0A2MRL4_9FLAO|nr:prephenate dehydrogenase [Flavobacterium subsaxonicum]KGO94186.1 prephenate dehydrogenase [Flavobacterium subsaxonicum WB 4.1-42 = DSM 21790]
MKVYVIGLGLIGGSLALDIKKAYPEAVLCGMDANEKHVEEALLMGLISHAAVLDDLKDADWVIVAVPVNTLSEILPDILNYIGENTIVFDAGSTKVAICKSVENHLRRRNFIATHPIAGTEFSGPSAAIHGLFSGKTNIICEVEKTAFKLQEKALELFKALGMRIRYMDPVSHDTHIAYVSHLSHISSFMLGKTVIEKEKDERDIFDMAGSGFASTVRLAKSSPTTWASIFKENKSNVSQALQQYIANLQNFQQLLENDDYNGMFEEMENTNRIKNILNGIN